MDFKGMSALITGAGRGVGSEIARQFALRGARVGLVSRTMNQLEGVRDEILRLGGEAIALCCDIAEEDQVERAVAKMNEAFGKVDVLVNNAAVFRGGMVDELSLEDWRIPIRVILDGTFLCTKHVLPGMKARGFGRIINISSAAVTHPFVTYSAYAAAKAGLLGFSRTLMEEVRPFGVTVNTIMLGLTNTDEVKQRASIPPEKMLQPVDVANTILFLASDAGSGYKGATLELFGDYQ